MIITTDGKKQYFDNTLISLIKNQNNAAVMSRIKDVKVQHLSDSQGDTLLHFAAVYDNTVVTQYLIDSGCNVDATDTSGWTPLHFAIAEGRVNTTNILLKANAKIGKFCDEIFLQRPMIARNPSDLEIIDNMFAKITSECSSNNDIARKLLELECPLPGVIFMNNAELTKLMLSHGCPVNDRLTGSNETALHLAVSRSDIENIKVLVEHGADVNATDSRNGTVLHRLQIDPTDEDEQLDILRLLLERGASLENSPAFTKRILSEGNSRIIRVLMPHLDLSPNREVGFFPLHELAQNKNNDIVELLHGKAFDVNARDRDGCTPLDKAADNNRVRMVQFLLENGADPNNIDEEDATVLTFLLEQPLRESEKTRRIVELLLQYGADAQFLWEGRNPIFHANDKGNFTLVQPVLAHLAMIESFGEPLHKYVREEIEASHIYESYFELCELQIEVMKSTIMYESVTMYSLLFETNRKIVMYSYNQEFAENHEIFVRNNQHNIDSYYISTIRLRVDRTLNLVQSKKKVAHIICEIMRLPVSMTSTIGYYVVAYLEYEDLQKVLQI